MGVNEAEAVDGEPAEAVDGELGEAEDGELAEASPVEGQPETKPGNAPNNEAELEPAPQ